MKKKNRYPNLRLKYKNLYINLEFLKDFLVFGIIFICVIWAIL